ncbi:hypothetical protein LCGC14_2622210, partial [marine sediment metagenome]
LPIYSSGDKTLDELLSGGFRNDLVYLLYGDRKIITNILLKTAVYSFLDKDFNRKVAYVDVNNRFNPYNISKLAASKRLSPRMVLVNILISRAFTWEQMVELLENRISQLENIKMIIIADITTLWPNYEQQTFEGMLQAISGIKKLIFKSKPLIILTGSINKYSEFKPKGGKYLAHFGSVLVLINNKEGYIEYQLIQHPSMPEKLLKKIKPKNLKRGMRKPLRNSTLDQWF